MIEKKPLFDRQDPFEIPIRGGFVSRFDFANRSQSSFMQKAREQLEQWFKRYPSNRSSLRSRFRSKKDANHDGALFELFLHELFLRLGLTVEVDPEIDRGSHPDFLVKGSNRTAYVEATYLKQRFETPPLEKTVLEAIDELGSQSPAGIGLHVEVDGELTMQPKLKPIMQKVLKWLESLDPLAIDWECEFNLCLPVDSMYGDWRLVLHAVPRGSAKSLITMGPSRISGRNPAKDLYDAVSKKASKYKNLQRPLVVAANVQSVGPNADEIDALFGPEGLRLRRSKLDSKWVSDGLVRTKQGLWFDNVNGQIRNRELDALMVFRNLAPWTIPNVTACLYLNPYVVDRVPEELRQLGYASHFDGELVCHDSKNSVGEIFELSSDWPGITFD